jgi:hypothetical protein
LGEGKAVEVLRAHAVRHVDPRVSVALIETSRAAHRVLVKLAEVPATRTDVRAEDARRGMVSAKPRTETLRRLEAS